MTQQEKIQQEIEETLNSLDGVKRAEANPYLFTRIKARMNKRTGVWERTFSFVSKPLVAFAVLALVMAMNGWAFFGTTTSNEIPDNLTAESENAVMPVFANEYQVVASVDNYDYVENGNK